MKHIAAMGYIIETGTDEYAPTNFSKALTIPIIGDGYPALYVSKHNPRVYPPSIMLTLIVLVEPTCLAASSPRTCSR